MKKLNAWTLAALAAACAASAFAAPASTGVKDPETGITLYPPKVAASAPPGTRQQKLAAEVRAAMQRVAAAPKKVALRTDDAPGDAMLGDKA